MGGSYTITDDQSDVDLCIIAENQFESAPTKTVCFQFFFKNESSNEYDHLDALVTPSNYLINIDNMFMSSIQKIFFNLNERIVYINPDYKKMQELINDKSFLERCQKTALLGLFDQMSLSLIDYVMNSKITLDKHVYELYYCYTMLSKTEFKPAIATRLKNISEETSIDPYLVRLFNDILQYCLQNPFDTISEQYRLNADFINAVKEDSKWLN